MNALQQIELKEIEDVQDLIFEVGVEEAIEQERFTIKTLDQANWAFRKLAALQAKENEVKALAEAERKRIDQYEEKELYHIRQSKEFFEGLLTRFAMEQKEKDPKFKAKTPYGSIGFRKQQPKWEYDDQVLLESLVSLGREDLIRIKKEPDKATLKKVLIVKEGQVIDPETGAKVDGVMVIDQPEKVDIKVEV